MLNEIVRRVRYEELDDLLFLYRQLHMDDPDIRNEPRLEDHWMDILEDPGFNCLVVEVDGKIVSSCC